jgi:hypothetical protein
VNICGPLDLDLLFLSAWPAAWPGQLFENTGRKPRHLK